MSQTFLHKGRRVDFDYWMYPDLSQDLDFDLLANMVTGSPTPSVTFGVESHVLDSFVEVEIGTRDDFQFAVGAALATWGAAMLVPGPVDLAVFAAGTYVAGPIGGVVAVVAYNVFALIVLATGLVLMYYA